MPVRHADPGRDGAACAAIYAPHVALNTTFEEDAPDFAQPLLDVGFGEDAAPAQAGEGGLEFL